MRSIFLFRFHGGFFFSRSGARTLGLGVLGSRHPSVVAVTVLVVLVVMPLTHRTEAR